MWSIPFLVPVPRCKRLIGQRGLLAVLRWAADGPVRSQPGGHSGPFYLTRPIHCSSLLPKRGLSCVRGRGGEQLLQGLRKPISGPDRQISQEAGVPATPGRGCGGSGGKPAGGQGQGALKAWLEVEPMGWRGPLAHLPQVHLHPPRGR